MKREATPEYTVEDKILDGQFLQSSSPSMCQSSLQHLLTESDPSCCSSAVALIMPDFSDRETESVMMSAIPVCLPTPSPNTDTHSYVST